MQDRRSTEDRVEAKSPNLAAEPSGNDGPNHAPRSQARIDTLGHAVRAISGQTRWTPQRKIALLTDVRTGRLAIETACQRFNLTVEEIGQWTAAFDRLGIDGVKATRKNPKDMHLNSLHSAQPHVEPRYSRRSNT